jgi:hypothetical protein
MIEKIYYLDKNGNRSEYILGVTDIKETKAIITEGKYTIKEIKDFFPDIYKKLIN